MKPGERRVAKGVTRGAPFRLTVDGHPVEVYPGETIATALLAAGIRLARRTAHRGAPRGVFCAIGVCHDCRMIVDGEANVRTCLEPARAGMVVETQLGFGGAVASPASDGSRAPAPVRRPGMTT
jgi:2Fe-2S iron-sulfur cluster binding domain